MKKYLNKISKLLLFSLLFQLLLLPLMEPAKANAENMPITDGVQRINADNLKWIPISKENPLGGADDFNALIFGKFAHFNESGGPVAAGKIEDVDTITFQEGQIGITNLFEDITIPKFNVGVIVQEELSNNKEINILNGDAVIGDSVSNEDFSHTVNVFKRQEQINQFMSNAEKDLKKLNEELWHLPKTGDAEADWGVINLNVKAGLNVFELDANSLSNNFSMAFNYEKDAKDSTIVIKANSNTINMGSTFINNAMMHNLNIDNISNRVIWVVNPDIQEMKIKSTHIFGTFLAPYTNLSLAEGYSAFNGTVIANGVDASDGARNSEFHYVAGFIRNFGEEDPEEPVEPEEPEEPEESTNPEEPTGPEEPIDPDKPVDPEEPEEPVNPEEPKEPGDPEKPPVDPNDPNSGKPVIPGKPSTEDPGSKPDPEPEPESKFKRSRR